MFARFNLEDITKDDVIFDKQDYLKIGKTFIMYTRGWTQNSKNKL